MGSKSSSSSKTDSLSRRSLRFLIATGFLFHAVVSKGFDYAIEVARIIVEPRRPQLQSVIKRT